MSLFSKTATTDDVYAVIIAVKRSCLGESDANEAVNRGLKTLRGRKDYVSAVIETLAEIGELLRQAIKQDDHMRESTESLVTRKIDLMTGDKSDAAAQAITELGRALFLDGSQDEIVALWGQQGRDPVLSDEERMGNVMDLVFVAGGIAAETKMEFTS